MICAYGEQMDLKLWSGESKSQQECLQITRLLDVYTKQSTMLKNKIHGEQVLGVPSKLVLASKKVIKRLKKSDSKIRRKVISFG